MTTEQKEQIKKLINEWLETLDTEKDYWDGIYTSDKGMAEKFMKGSIGGLEFTESKNFFNWLEEKNGK